jgi:predicted nucleic acid-binding Zn ribbon protein
MNCRNIVVQEMNSTAVEPMRCPKCDGAMEQGFVMDFTHGSRLVSSWVPGPPMKSFWFGTQMPAERLVPIGAFRCTRCGFLESYARDDLAPQ